MFDTPKARDNFQLDCSHRATPRLARMAHASSTTTTTPDRRCQAGHRRLEPGGGTGHEHAERGRVVDGGQVENDEGTAQTDARRSSRPSNIPWRSPATKPTKLEGHVSAVGGQCLRRGAHGARPTARSAPAALRPPRAMSVQSAGPVVDAQASTPSATASSMAVRSVGASVRPRLAAAKEASSSARRRVTSSRPSPDGWRVQRVQPHPHPGRSATGSIPQARARAPYSPFGSTTQAPAAEHRLSPEVGLHERALAPADLAEHDHVGVGEDAATDRARRGRRRRRHRAGPGRSAHHVHPVPLRTRRDRRRRDGGWWPDVRERPWVECGPFTSPASWPALRRTARALRAMRTMRAPRAMRAMRAMRAPASSAWPPGPDWRRCTDLVTSRHIGRFHSNGDGIRFSPMKTNRTAWPGSMPKTTSACWESSPPYWPPPLMPPMGPRSPPLVPSALPVAS